MTSHRRIEYINAVLLDSRFYYEKKSYSLLRQLFPQISITKPVFVQLPTPNPFFVIQLLSAKMPRKPSKKNRNTRRPAAAKAAREELPQGWKAPPTPQGLSRSPARRFQRTAVLEAALQVREYRSTQKQTKSSLVTTQHPAPVIHRGNHKCRKIKPTLGRSHKLFQTHLILSAINAHRRPPVQLQVHSASSR